MKVLHISKYANGGAGIAALRLHLGLLENNISSYFLSQFTSDQFIPNSFLLENVTKDKSSFTQKIKKKAKNKIWGDSQIDTTKLSKELPKEIELFSTIKGKLNGDFISFINQFDVIHLHWVSDFLDWKSFWYILKGKKIVLTLHDVEAFTGGCHYFGPCTQYVVNCKNCPQLLNTHVPDLANIQFKLKDNILKLMHEEDITIVSPSQWMFNAAKNSQLLKYFNHICIPNTINTEVFKKLDSYSIRLEYNISEKEIVLLFICQNINNSRKGLDILLSALQMINGINITLLILGNKLENYVFNSGTKVIEFGTILNESKLTELYNLADLVIVPSREDNFPNTVLESLCCGTPVICFTIGGLTDLIINGKNGILCGDPSSENLKTGIKKFLSGMSIDKNVVSNQASNLYSWRLIVGSHIEIYNRKHRF